MNDQAPPAKPGFQIFRAADGCKLEESASMRYEAMTPVIEQGLTEMNDAGLTDGYDVRILFEIPGFSLTHAWFKSGYPLPLHTHDVACLYFIVAGSLRLGTNDLSAGDGFFVPANVPYTYTPGPAGTEVIEFRNAVEFDIRFLAKGSSYWAKAVKTIEEHRGAWQTEPRPLLNA